MHGQPTRFPCQPGHLRRTVWLLAGLAALALSGCDQRRPVNPGSGAEKNGDARRGQQLLAQYQCGSCHAIPGVAAARGLNGPSLQAFGRRSYIAGQLPNNPSTLAKWIVAPASLVPGTSMPSMGVSPEEARHMAAYLEGLR